MSSRRIKQMSSLMREQLARLLLHELNDPRLQDLVVTEVEMTGDLKRAYVYYTRGALTGSASDKEVLEGLKKAAPFIRKRLGSELDLRSVPELQFELDTHGKDLNRILSLLESVTELGESERKT